MFSEEMLRGAIMARWCSGCQAEEAVTTIDAQFNGEWISLDVGQKCLTRLEDEGRMEIEHDGDSGAGS